jgi:hypothetical protein
MWLTPRSFQADSLSARLTLRRPTVCMVNIKLDDTDASKIVEVMLHLAALIDPDDPDGLRDAFGQRDQKLEQYLLTNAQFMMLRHPAYRDDDRDHVAQHLREIAAKIEGQLPPSAPEVWLGRRR